ARAAGCRVCGRERGGGGAQDASGGGRKWGFPLRAVVRGRQQERLPEVDADGSTSNGAIPAWPDFIGSRDGARYDGHAGPQGEPDRAAPRLLQAAVPRSLAFRVDPDRLSLLQAAEHHADRLGVDLVAAHRKRLHLPHDPAHERRCELRTLGHGVDRPGAHRLYQDGIEDALVVREQQERAGFRNMVEPVNLEAADEPEQVTGQERGEMVEEVATPHLALTRG